MLDIAIIILYNFFTNKLKNHNSMDKTKMQKSDHDKFDVLNEVNLLQQDAINFGFNWPNMDMIIEQIISECKEIEQANHDN